MNTGSKRAVSARVNTTVAAGAIVLRSYSRRSKLEIGKSGGFPLGAGVNHRAFFSVAHGLGITPQRARLIFGLPRLPCLAPLGQFLVRELDRERAVDRVHHDDVAVLQQADRPADRRLGTDMSDAETARAAGEAAVGDERHVVARALTVKRGGGGQHLAHAGAAARTLVADHQHVALLVFPRLDRGEAILLAVEATRRAAELEVDALHARDLADAALRREIALEHHQPAGRRQRLRGGINHVLALGHAHVLEILLHGLAGDGEAVAVQVAAVEQRLHQYRHAADGV